MAHTLITFIKPSSPHLDKIIAPFGFSWTVLFFGFWPPLLRGHFSWFLIIFILNICTFGIARLVFCFTYNDTYLKYLILKGYLLAPGHDQEIIKSLEMNLAMRIPMLYNED